MSPLSSEIDVHSFSIIVDQLIIQTLLNDISKLTVSYCGPRNLVFTDLR